MRRPQRPPLPLVLGLALVPVCGVAHAGDAPDGRRVYAEQCGGCHGDDGRGDGPAAAALVPKPRNFRDPAFWNGRTPAELESVVRGGKPGTMMMPFGGTLSDAEIAAVVRFVEGFAPGARRAP